MPPIMIWAVVTGDAGVLLVPARAVDGWLLPGGPLRDDDESVESAVMREVAERFGVQLAAEPEFLDTRYERRPDGSSVVHNLFHVPSVLLGGGVDALGNDVRWLSSQELEEESLPAWLREGVGPLYGLESATEAFDFGDIERALGRFVDLPPVWIITGPAGAGKSTVARELAGRYERAAHIDMDQVNDLVHSGRVAWDGGPDEAAARDAQAALVALNSAALARNFVEAGLVAVIEGVLETTSNLDDLVQALGPNLELRFVTLLPDATTLAARDAGRDPEVQMGARSEDLRRIIGSNGETRGLRLDTSGQTPEQTVDIILRRVDETRLPRVWEATP